VEEKMKIKTYITLDGNTLSLPLAQLKELYSITSVESEYVVVGQDITEEYFNQNIAIDWKESLPFVVIDGVAIGSYNYVIRKFIRDGLISSSFFKSAEGA
jgi:hypothetical protein